MPPRPRGVPDWREARAYEPLLQLERAGFAWEWLRRDGGYREASRQARLEGSERGAPGEPSAAPWGLHAFEDSGLAAPQARPVWRSEVHKLVLRAIAVPAQDEPDGLSLDRLRQSATIVREPGSEHLLLSDGRRSIRLDVAGASLLAGPVRLHYQLHGIEAARAPLLVLRRLLALHETGSFQSGLHPPETRARRLIAMLRTHDAIEAGASQREIATVLLSRDASHERWRINSPALRSRVQRLVRAAARMAAGEYVLLL